MTDIDIASSAFVKRLVSGDREAFADLVDQTSGRIYNLALRMLNNEQDAEDVLQETFIKAFNALPNFEGRSSVTTWLYRIASNEALMIMRKRKNAGAMIEIDKDEDDDERPLEIVDWCCLPESEMMTDETQSELQSAVEKLTIPLKMVFLLRDVQGFSGQETAEILGINENAVKTRLVRARMKLQQELSSYFRDQMKGEVANG